MMVAGDGLEAVSAKVAESVNVCQHVYNLSICHKLSVTCDVALSIISVVER